MCIFAGWLLLVRIGWKNFVMFAKRTNPTGVLLYQFLLSVPLIPRVRRRGTKQASYALSVQRISWQHSSVAKAGVTATTLLFVRPSAVLPQPLHRCRFLRCFSVHSGCFLLRSVYSQRETAYHGYTLCPVFGGGVCAYTLKSLIVTTDSFRPGLNFPLRFRAP